MGAMKEGGRSRAVVLVTGDSMAVESCRCPTSCNRGCLLPCMAAEEVVVAAGTTARATDYFCHRRKVFLRRDWNSSPLLLEVAAGLPPSRFGDRRSVGSAAPPSV
ncbi:uncharacterized protein LOC130935437 [Arachis stenosperma]|uniref:uncharacterized protein LOC130935437 n=1 Tax=Arachis stenosperma TaxID=217475 RepID=UPI0025AD5271|nr:uncharacterized protein LOC130935437 [Arachis stenosperma]